MVAGYAGRPLGHQPGEGLEHHDRDDDDRERERDEQHPEADVAVLLRRLDVTGLGSGDRALAQLLAAAAVERGFLLEGILELVEALAHAKVGRHGSIEPISDRSRLPTFA